MILAIETSTAMCSAALYRGDALLDTREERIGRGHAERLVPMVEALLGNHVPSAILVSCGPGSFTGIRVGIAAAQGLAIGWQVPLHGFSSLAAIAAAARDTEKGDAPITAVMPGGHGELFVQGFCADPVDPIGTPISLKPADAARRFDGPILAGPAAAQLAQAGAIGKVVECDPLARHALLLAPPLRQLDPAPLYVRPPDAKPKAA